MKKIKKFIVIPLRETVLFPGMISPIFIGRKESMNAVKLAGETGKSILFLTQKHAKTDKVTKKDLYEVGTTIEILQYLDLPTGTIKIMVEGTGTAKIVSFKKEKNVFVAEAEVLEERKNEPAKFFEKETTQLIKEFGVFVRNSRKIHPDILTSLEQTDDIGAVLDIIVEFLDLKIPKLQKALELFSTKKRIVAFTKILAKKNTTTFLDNKISRDVTKRLDKNQKDFYLNEKLKAIQKELGDEKKDLGKYEKKLKEKELPKSVIEKAKEEIDKLKKMHSMSGESSGIRNYLDWIFDLPWLEKTELSNDLKVAEKILDKDHYGLEKIKERILEYLAVQKRTGKAGGTVLCFVGPPGVGKTSLGQSIARAVGRKFERVALGGVRDSTEIYGHRRTYLGSQPGRIMSSLKKTKTNNPLIMLDEIDKMSADWRGDPSSAMLEVLDPAQNNKFNDHYIEMDYDLSDIMFITTANSLNIPRPLLDRMEVIHLSGYTEEEKIKIAEKYLMPKQLKEAGLHGKEITIKTDAIRKIIRNYTQEAGVRSLERAIAKIMRKVLKKIEDKEFKSKKIDAKNLENFLGAEKIDFGRKQETDNIGIVNGLAWTEMGGDLLTIEAVSMPGKGEFLLTGTLGDVMKESIQTAKSFVRSRAKDFGISDKIFKNTDIHIHLPEGAIPKDGPSAGLGMATAIISILTGIPVSKDVAMTGEITLQGRALAIGGLKEKLLAALRAGIKTVIIPERNQKDLKELPENVKKGLKIIPVKNLQEVIKIALVKK
ncbi:MAG: endopeptidase La [Alphaproteobacteria bacterium]|nr:MAG: endopeptidase La [Rickettsiaceae bacterium 4572_127]